MARLVTDYERGLIGAILCDPAKRMAQAMTVGVRAEWFTVDAWSLVWSVLESAWNRGTIESVSPVTAMSDAQSLAAKDKERRTAEQLTASELQRAIDESPIFGIDETVRLLRNCYIERQTKAAVASELQILEQWADTTDGVLALREKLDKILKGQIENKKISPRAAFAEIMAEYEEAYKMRVDPNGPRDLKWIPKTALKLPWPKMTEFMNGLRPGLHIVAARPSVGKTAFAINLMHYWLESGEPVLFNSLDMGEREVLRRYIAEKARVSARKAAFSPTLTDLEAMRAAVAAMSDWPLSIYEEHDVDDLRTICKIEKSADRLRVLVVDYLQLMHARALGREDAVEYTRVGHVSDTLKRIALELNIPVVALAQLNRESTKQDQQGRLPGLADLRGSGAIEQDAFTVTILHRDGAVVDKWRELAQTRGPEYERVARLIPGTMDNPQYRYNFDDLDPVWWILCKAQNGPTGKLPFLVRKKYFTWMLADYEAETKKTTSGYGATQKTTVDNSPKFERVHSDWRHDAIEEVLRLQLALIQDADDVANIDEES